MKKETYSILSVFCFLFVTQIATAEASTSLIEKTTISHTNKNNVHHNSNVYASVQYNGNFFANVTNLEAKEKVSNISTKQILGFDRDKQVIPYSPEYYTDFFSAGVP